MALKDNWIRQDNTMDADASIVNQIADAVIQNEEDIKDLKENGGGGTTDGITKEYADKTYATKEELENFTSNEKVYDYSSETTNDLILEHNSLYYFGVLTTLNIAISSDVNIESVDAPFECSIMFTSGETATNLDYSASPIIWSGDDCDSDGHFVPEANKTYEISIKKFGLTISARVGVI